jgi:hypothetical protein
MVTPAKHGHLVVAIIKASVVALGKPEQVQSPMINRIVMGHADYIA